jgi:hypothetical protein
LQRDGVRLAARPGSILGLLVSDIEPPVEPRDLPPEVAELRGRAAEEHEWLDETAQPNIDARIEALAQEVEHVIDVHRQIADRTDLEIRADTRWSAIWELSCRCLAICRVVLHDLRGGFTSEAVGSLRTLFEAAELLGAVAFHAEEDLVRRWLAGEWIRPRDARQAMGRKAALAEQRMKSAGLEPPERGPVETGAEIYDLLSQPAHNRRGGSPETISVPLREFVYGPHPNAERRAHHLAYAEQLIETALLIVIDSLSDIIGREYANNALPAMQQRLEQARERFPLPGEGDE